MKPLVSVIIVSYNTKELTLRSVQSVSESEGFKAGEIEIIVVDNNSTDDTVNYLGQNLEQFRLIVNPRNLGFGAANNQGAQVAGGEYLLFLNSDAFLSPQALRGLVDNLITHQGLYSSGPQLRYADGRLQLSAGYFPTPKRVLGWMLGLDKIPLVKLFFPTPYHVFSQAYHQEKQYPDWLMGACIIFRKREFLQVGGFDEQIFMYSEEVDLYMRLFNNLGKKVFFDPSIFATHLGRSSSVNAGTAVLIEEIKGIKYIYTKQYPHLVKLISLIIRLGIFLRILIFSLLKSRQETVIEYKKLLKNT